MTTNNEAPERLKILQSTIQMLYSRSGNICAYPGCEERFYSIDRDNVQNLSNICHIESANKGGERFNPKQTNEERRHYDNLILLCPNHHKITNDVNKYTVEVLRDMKLAHESLIDQRLRAQEKIYAQPSILAIVISTISQSIDNILECNNNEVLAPFSIEQKIKYNCITRYKDVFQDYAIFQGSISAIYEELEMNGPQRNTQIILTQSVRTQYLKIKSLTSNPDDIIDKIKVILTKTLEGNTELSPEIIDIALDIIIVDVFMRCKIFSPPPKLEDF